MEVWNYLQILGQKKQGWLFKKDNVKERINALHKISELGYPSLIPNLIPYLKDHNNLIQLTTCEIIIHFFKRINTKKNYYESLKHCDISKSDISFYQQTFSSEQYLTLLSIASLNSNGYVREKAIDKLVETNSDKAIPFVIYRLADWVEVVRQTALAGIELFKKKKFINALLENLTVFEWLQKVERTDLSYVYSDIMKFVVEENNQYILDNFKAFSDKARIVIAKQLSSIANIKLEVLKALLDDKHFLVRSFALLHFDKFTQTDIDKLLKDKSSRVRIQTLYNLKNNADFSEIIFPFISDDSISVREFARYSLKKKITDFAAIYNDNLIDGKNVIGALSGLGETHGKEFVGTIETFLNNEVLKVRKAAFLALKKLDREKAFDFALQNLDNEYISIRNVVIEFLSIYSRQDVLKKARETYSNGNLELKKSMLKLFGKIGRITSIADIMIGTIDENGDIRQISFNYLQQWRNKATASFTQPSKEDIERANQVFRFAFELHEEKKYFDQNPLTGIDFYLR